MSNSGLYFKDKGHATTSRNTLGYELKKKKKKKGFPGGSGGKESTCNAGDVDSIPGSGRSSREGNSNPLQYCLENPMDRGAWRATVHGVAHSQDRTERLHYFFMSSRCIGTAQGLLSVATILSVPGIGRDFASPRFSRGPYLCHPDPSQPGPAGEHAEAEGGPLHPSRAAAAWKQRRQSFGLTD